jgi:transcription elongation GreA/GreB family factor
MHKDANVIKILKIDLDWVDQRVLELDKLIMDLSEEFREAFTQSSETWHDNAMFDNVREKQNVLSAEQQNLWGIRRKAYVVKPATGRKKTAQIGNIVTLRDEYGKEMRLVIGGDYISPEIVELHGVKRVSAASPIGLQVIDRKVGEEVIVGSKLCVISEIAKP